MRSSRHVDERRTALFDRVASTSAERAAAVILAGVRRNRVFVGPDAHFMQFVKRLMPDFTVRVTPRVQAFIESWL